MNQSSLSAVDDWLSPDDSLKAFEGFARYRRPFDTFERWMS